MLAMCNIHFEGVGGHLHNTRGKPRSNNRKAHTAEHGC